MKNEFLKFFFNFRSSSPLEAFNFQVNNFQANSFQVKILKRHLLVKILKRHLLVPQTALISAPAPPSAHHWQSSPRPPTP